jgi:hypothetical protein
MHVAQWHVRIVIKTKLLLPFIHLQALGCCGVASCTLWVSACTATNLGIYATTPSDLQSYIVFIGLQALGCWGVVSFIVRLAAGSADCCHRCSSINHLAC